MKDLSLEWALPPLAENLFMVKPLIDEKLKGAKIGPIVIAAELRIDMRDVFASFNVSDIKIDRGNQRRDFMHHRKDGEIRSGVARNAKPAAIASITRLSRRNPRGEGRKIEAAIAAGMFEKVGKFFGG